jgi:hypothetical protein
VRRAVLSCLLGCVAILTVSGCGSTPAPISPRPTINIAPVRLLIAPPAVSALANAFDDQFIAKEYEEQWGELAPQAQAMWPSASARTAMLTRKFARATVLSVSLGDPDLEQTWTAPESPSVQVDDVWSFPVEVVFAHGRRRESLLDDQVGYRVRCGLRCRGDAR